MINACVEQESPFGVVLLEDGIQVGQRDVTPYPVGCTAMITRVQKLPGGRMNILSVGQERFRINALNYDHKYLAADVTIYPLTDTTPTYTKQAGAKLYTLVASYLKALQDAGQIQLDASQIPSDPIALCHLAAIILSVDTETQQTLLETDNTQDLLSKLIKIYSLELALVDRMRLEAARDDNGLPFSWN